MKKISKFVLAKIKRDVETIKKEARIAIEIFPDGKFKVIENNDGRLDAIVIFGPCPEINFQEAVLAEIGLGRTKPYNESRGLRSKDGLKYICSRKKIFSLSKEQYLSIAPFIFRLIITLNDRKVMSWKNGSFSENPFVIPHSRNYFSRRQKRLFYSEDYRHWPNGTRFSVSLKDEFLASDIYWAEIHLNKRLQERLEGLAKFIDLRMNCYKENGWVGKRFLNLKGVQEVKEILKRSKLPTYLLREMVEMKLIKDHRFFEILEDLNHKSENIFSHSPEHNLAIKSLPDQKARLDSIQLRVTTGLERKKDFIVFEVMPSGF